MKRTLQNARLPIPLKSGVILPSGLFPGPMEGVMSPVFCHAMNTLQLTNYWMTPFIRISTDVPRLKKLKKKLNHFLNTSRPISVQLLGHNPELLAKTALRLQELGVTSVNLNFACPSRRVVRHNGGGGLLKNPERIYEILNTIKQRCPTLSLSAKLRYGLSSTDELFPVLDVIKKVELDFLILHFRTVDELYYPVSDGIQRLKIASDYIRDVPMLGSGDIFSVQYAEKMITEANLYGVVVARGLIKNPFFLLELQGKKSNISIREHKQLFFDTALQFKNENPELCGTPALIEIARNLWGRESSQFKIICKELISKD
jgi:tRNA-dihydrouridine synthase